MSTLFPGTSARGASAHLRLRRWLALDAVVTGVNGLAYLALSGPLSRFLGLDSTLLLALGALLLLYGAAVGAQARPQRPRPFWSLCIVEANLGWVVLSIAALALWLEPSTAGAVWIVLQAAVVATFAAAQYAALRAGARTR
ncbi:hypothetical protein PJ985_11190 [Streptomyces sp. ACA25]|uniref:hypothetical protein n=1 Tax=Streptomyces sp. ACA25 TaxID=3022596 RepID=UPI0023073FB2|nr:hypothetical protein [Streptomyces sp. ACA25]MDB1088128.1 hypothetical protein [Streptomyces sp. ACA25]